MNTGNRVELLQGTLDLIVLRALLTMGPQHAYGLAARLDQIADHPFPLNQGTLYVALVRLEQKGWIKGTWQTHRVQPRGEGTTRSPRAGIARAREADRAMAAPRRLRGQTAAARSRRDVGSSGASFCGSATSSGQGAAEQQLDREMAAHLAMLEDDLQRRGLTREQAVAAARRAVGGVDR